MRLAFRDACVAEGALKSKISNVLLVIVSNGLTRGLRAGGKKNNKNRGRRFHQDP